jgi:predicted Ser/Thr protein kinase
VKKRRPNRQPPPRALGKDEPWTTNPQLRAAILEVVDTQLENNDPPQTRATLERLVARGYSREGARELIGQAVVDEIAAVMASHKPYNAACYLAALDKLGETGDP